MPDIFFERMVIYLSIFNTEKDIYVLFVYVTKKSKLKKKKNRSKVNIYVYYIEAAI